jgi:leucyl-tRNA synthetase
MNKYNHKSIETKWQKKWADEKANTIDKDDVSKPKFYLLDMFPYPSGDGLHMGHTEAYTANDIYSRYKKSKGFNVMHPTGFDAFGLPAENYAIKTGVHPKETTKQNSENFKKQLNSLGINYDFSESVNTSNPYYYKWTQWLFARFFENDLVYQKTDKVNWCKSCQTVLANEQVEAGACERCKTEVVMKEVPSWFFKITDFADDLIDGLGNIDWPEHTKKNQINWIGKSKGAKIDFQIKAEAQHPMLRLKVFTTRADTLFGATYMVLSPEHEYVEQLRGQITNWDEVEKYISKAAKKTEIERTANVKDKTGVKLEGITAINPANKEEIPVFIADYVLAHYGTGAIMAVPAHDERDLEFAKKYKLAIRSVIQKKKPDDLTATGALIRTTDGKFLFQEKDDGAPNDANMLSFFGGRIESGESLQECLIRELKEELELNVKDSNFPLIDYIQCQTKDSFYSLAVFFVDNVDRKALTLHEGRAIFEVEDLNEVFRDGNVGPLVEKFVQINGSSFEWRAYTEPGDLINSGEFDGLENEDAKIKITDFVGGKKTDTYRLRDWSVSRQRYWGAPIPIVYDPKGKAHVVPDEHLPWLLPEDVDFVPKGESPLSQSKELKERTEKIFGKGWVPEADTMDTFVDSAWYFLRYPDPHNEKEFCSKARLDHWLPVDLYVGGSEHTYLHLMYARFFTRAMHKIGLLNFDEPFLKMRHQGMVLDQKGVKMSKSKGNIVSPDEVVSKFGADAVRLYMMFATPLADDVLWDESGIVGTYRFLERAVGMKDYIGEGNDRTEREINKLIKKVGEDIEALKFNTAISAMMIFVNVVNEEKLISKEEFALFVQVLAPFAPHIAEELWEQRATSDVVQSVHEQSWPEYDDSKITDNEVTIAVQVNGKVRGEIEVSSNAPQIDVENPAMEVISKWLDGAKIKKTIYIPNRLINFVV